MNKQLTFEFYQEHINYWLEVYKVIAIPVRMEETRFYFPPEYIEPSRNKFLVYFDKFLQKIDDFIG